jgi:hypothetical protein
MEFFIGYELATTSRRKIHSRLLGNLGVRHHPVTTFPKRAMLINSSHLKLNRIGVLKSIAGVYGTTRFIRYIINYIYIQLVEGVDDL